METNQRKYPLYSTDFEHDACGIGAVVSIDGIASHAIVDDALSIVERLEHRAGTVSYTHLTLPTICSV